MKNKRILCAVIAVFLLVSIFTAQIEAGDTSSAFDGYVSELIRMIEEKIEKWKDYSVDHSAFEALSRRPDSFTLPKAADDEIKSIISVIITEENAQFYAENAVRDNDMCDSASVDLNDYYLEYYADLNFSEQFAESGYDPGTVWNLLSYPVICIPIYGEIDQQRHVTGRIELKYSQFTDYYDVSVVSYVKYTGRDEDKYIFEPVDNILKRAEKYRGDENTQIIVMRSVIDVGIAVMIWTDGGRAVYDYRNSCENPEYGFMDPRIYEFIEYEFEDYFALREQHEKKRLENSQSANSLEDLFMNAIYGGVAAEETTGAADKTTGAAAGKKTAAVVIAVAAGVLVCAAAVTAVVVIKKKRKAN